MFFFSNKKANLGLLKIHKRFVVIFKHFMGFVLESWQVKDKLH